MKLENLTSSEIELVQRDSHDLWSGGVSLEARILKVHALLSYPDRPFRYLGLKSGDFVHCSAKIYECEAQLHDAPLRLLGVGALFTDPKKRGQGIASQMVREIANLARVGGYHGAYLWSDIGVDFYRSLEFHEIPIRQVSYKVHVDEKLLKDIVVSPTMVEDIRNLAELHKLATKDKEFKITRRANRWNFWRVINSSVDFKVTYQNNFVGYFTAAQNTNMEYYWLEEAFALPGNENLLANAIADRAAYHGKNMIRGWDWFHTIFPDPPLKVTPVTKPIPMVKLFSVSDQEKFATATKHYLSSVDHF